MHRSKALLATTLLLLLTTADFAADADVAAGAQAVKLGALQAEGNDDSGPAAAPDFGLIPPSETLLQWYDVREDRSVAAAGPQLAMALADLGFAGCELDPRVDTAGLPVVGTFDVPSADNFEAPQVGSASERLCYDVHCGRRKPLTFVVTDRFGARPIQVFATKVVCTRGDSSGQSETDGMSDALDLCMAVRDTLDVSDNIVATSAEFGFAATCTLNENASRLCLSTLARDKADASVPEPEARLCYRALCGGGAVPGESVFADAFGDHGLADF